MKLKLCIHFCENYANGGVYYRGRVQKIKKKWSNFDHSTTLLFDNAQFLLLEIPVFFIGTVCKRTYLLDSAMYKLGNIANFFYFFYIIENYVWLKINKWIMVEFRISFSYK